MNITRLREIFAGFPFGPPCSPSDLATAERRLGHALPPPLVDLYASFDGFEGPTGAQFFYPLVTGHPDPAGSLVEQTLFLRSEGYFPDFVHRAVAVGDDGCGPYWMVFLDPPGRVVRWDAEWGNDYEIVDGGLLDAWSRRKATYDRLD